MRIEMPEKRKKYDREFREGSVRIVEETNKPIAQVARDLGVNEGTAACSPCSASCDANSKVPRAVSAGSDRREHRQGYRPDA